MVYIFWVNLNLELSDPWTFTLIFPSLTTTASTQDGWYQTGHMAGSPALLWTQIGRSSYLANKNNLQHMCTLSITCNTFVFWHKGSKAKLYYVTICTIGHGWPRGELGKSISHMLLYLINWRNKIQTGRVFQSNAEKRFQIV